MNSFHVEKPKVNSFKFPIVQENQIVQPKEAEREPIKLRINLKNSTTINEMEGKQKKKKEKKKPKEKKIIKRKKIRKEKKLLENENSAAPVECNETTQKPSQPIGQKKIRPREVIKSTILQNVILSPI